MNFSERFELCWVIGGMTIRRGKAAFAFYSLRYVRIRAW